MPDFERLIHLRAARYPLQYIIGTVDFMGFELAVRPGVFIPRPETEILVETILGIAGKMDGTKERLRILDLCTGSGNIAISLTKFLKAVNIIASDVSGEALKTAEENITKHNSGDIRLIESDLFSSIGQETFDIIASNPPYVADADFDTLMPELMHEPRISLSGGEDGLRFYKRILDEAYPHLNDGGHLILEIGYNQAKDIKETLDTDRYFLKGIIKDYNGVDRVMALRKRNG
jgi:release factor glutamine methyltransferase